MRRALKIVSEFDLDVRFVSYGTPSRAILQLAKKFEWHADPRARSMQDPFVAGTAAIPHWNADDMSTLERAIVIAAEAHAGMTDKAGAPYILHPLRLMLALSDASDRIVAVLHDVVEDCDGWTLARIRSEGFSEEVIEALESVTPAERRRLFFLRAPCGSKSDRTKS
jgi:hypothetical protein